MAVGVPAYQESTRGLAATLIGLLNTYKLIKNIFSCNKMCKVIICNITYFYYSDVGDNDDDRVIGVV